mgnify:CR=1 FL=1
MTEENDPPIWLLRLAESSGSDDPRHIVLARLNRASKGLSEGDLGPFADMLKAGDEIPPFLRAGLVFLIEGTAEQSGGRRLSMEKRPDLVRASQGEADLQSQRRREIEIAGFMARRGGLKPGEHEAAVADTMAEYSLKRARVEQIWSLHRDAMAQRAARSQRTSPIDLKID